MTTQPTNEQLKLALAKMLPGQLWMIHESLFWTKRIEGTENYRAERIVLDTELLHVCWLVECDMPYIFQRQYATLLYNSMYHQADGMPSSAAATFLSVCASWQHRTIALAKIKGVEIV